MSISYLKLVRCISTFLIMPVVNRSMFSSTVTGLEEQQIHYTITLGFVTLLPHRKFIKHLNAVPKQPGPKRRGSRGGASLQNERPTDRSVRGYTSPIGLPASGRTIRRQRAVRYHASQIIRGAF
jgi:hypothetical protein